MATSQNGWGVLRYSWSPLMRDFPWVTGKVRRGAVFVVMSYLAEQFEKRVEPIARWKSWGWAFRPVRGSSSGYSNHASATAVDFNAPDHWLGAVGTFSPAQVLEIRAILTELDGVVRWGGDYLGRKDEMHFEIVGTPAQVRAVARKIKRKKDWFSMATEAQLQKVVTQAINTALTKPIKEGGAPIDLGDGKVRSVAQVLKELWQK